MWPKWYTVHVQPPRSNWRRENLVFYQLLTDCLLSTAESTSAELFCKIDKSRILWIQSELMNLMPFMENSNFWYWEIGRIEISAFVIRGHSIIYNPELMPNLILTMKWKSSFDNNQTGLRKLAQLSGNPETPVRFHWNLADTSYILNYSR